MVPAPETDAHDWDFEQCALAHWFGLSEGRARVLAALWRAQGRVVLASGFNLDRRSLYVYVCDLRTALDPGAIRTHSKSGYALTPSGLLECSAAIHAMSALWYSGTAVEPLGDLESWSGSQVVGPPLLSQGA